MRKAIYFFLAVAVLQSCSKKELRDNTAAEIPGKAGNNPAQESPDFTLLRSFNVGSAGAAEISAFDPLTQKLFVVNNSAGNNRIDVFNLSNPSQPILLGNINTANFGGFVNSVSVSHGKLAAAVEAAVKVNPGKVVVFNTTDHSVIANVTVGSLPDMVTFSPNGKLIVSANEGEPNDSYTIDPVGSVSIIAVDENYSVTNLDFAAFSSQADALKAKGFRISGFNAGFAQDIEPEYIAISENSKKAWVTLQENNGIALIDLESKSVTNIFPLGFKDYNDPSNSIDPSDEDGGVFFNPWKVKGIYMPDAIAVMPNNNVPFVFTANEGDSREYRAFTDIRRINNAAVKLDPVAFPNAADLKQNNKLGRLNITPTLGDTDGDGDLDELYSFGARSFSIWNGLTGELLYDSKDFIDKKMNEIKKYPDGRSDDKGSEPEGIATGRVGNTNLVFVGLERANAIMIFEMITPQRPSFRQVLNTGTAPEGILFIGAADSPTGKSLLIVSNETSGTIDIFTTN